MNIVILGAGQVGGSLAAALVGEHNNVTVVDTDKVKLNNLREKLDIGTVCGHASHPDVMRSANCMDADMIIAVTNNDETNMIACQVAYTVFSTPKKIARVRSEIYKANEELFADEAIPIDEIIVPEQLVSDYVVSLISHPGARHVIEFSGKKLDIITVRVDKNSSMANKSIMNFNELYPEKATKILAIYNKAHKIEFDSTTVFKAHDEVILAVKNELTAKVIQGFQRNLTPYKSIMIAGGGHIGFALAKNLEHKYSIKVIDPGEERVAYLAQNLEKALVLKGDASDSELLIDENIVETDLFCAVTNNDGVNILSALLAKRLGARKVISLITRGSYSELISGSEIDAAISPQNVTVSALLKLIRRGDIIQAHSLREGTIEILELIVHGDHDTSDVVGKKVCNIKLPKNTRLVSIERDGQVILDIDQEVIQSEDKVVIFVSDKNKLHEVEKMFQVAAFYL